VWQSHQNNAGSPTAGAWRAAAAESLLFGAEPTDEAFAAAIDAELADAKPLPGNEFKLDLTRRTVVAVLRRLRDEGVTA